MKIDQVGEVGVVSEIRDEAAAQAKKFEEVFERRPTHIDTHYHMHRLPRVLDAVLEVASDLELPVRAVTPEMTDRPRVGWGRLDRPPAARSPPS